MCPAKICVHHKVVLTFHDKCVKCVCPTAALVAESRAFRLVKSRTTFKHAHTLMIWCKTETWKYQQELVLGEANPLLFIWLHSNNVSPLTYHTIIYCITYTCHKMLHKPGRFTKLWAKSNANNLINALASIDVPLTFLKFLGLCRSLLLCQLDHHSTFV